MDADDLRASLVRRSRDRTGGVLQIGDGAGKRRGHHRRRAVARVEREDACIRALVGVHEVGAVAAVNVDVDEPGNDERRGTLGVARNLARLFDADDRAVVDRDQRIVLNRAANERAAVQTFHRHSRSDFPANRARASSAGTRHFAITTATRTSPFASRSACTAIGRVTPAASSTMRTARLRSFSFVAGMSTIRFECTRPRRIITPVEIVLRMIFCAVPLFIRVEPMITSGPLSATMAMSATAASGVFGVDVMPTVSAPIMFARRIAATVNGVVPDAAMPTTASSAFTC